MTKLNQGNILSLEEKAFKKKEITVTIDDKDFKVVIDKDFKETKITEMFTELVKRSDYARKNDVDFDVTAFLLVLIIKHFTDIEFVEKEELKDTMDYEIRTLNALINLGVFEEIMNNFDKMRKIFGIM